MARKPANVPDHVRQAAKLFKSFTGHEGEILGKIDLPANPKSLICIGELVDVGYITVRDGKRERYRHEFKSSARPLVTVSFDGRQLFILGGEYSFTDRGIDDK